MVSGRCGARPKGLPSLRVWKWPGDNFGSWIFGALCGVSDAGTCPLVGTLCSPFGVARLMGGLGRLGSSRLETSPPPCRLRSLAACGPRGSAGRVVGGWTISSRDERNQRSTTTRQPTGAIHFDVAGCVKSLDVTAASIRDNERVTPTCHPTTGNRHSGCRLILCGVDPGPRSFKYGTGSWLTLSEE